MGTRQQQKTRIYHAISSTFDADDRRAQLDIARSIPIHTFKRLGKYKAGKNHPISITFEKKSHADVLFESKSWLPYGVYIDQKYTQEIENQCKLLCPILKLAQSIEKDQGKCRMVNNYLVILGKQYGVQDLHQLPNILSGFHASSRSNEDNTIHAFFGKLSPFSNFHRAPLEVNWYSYFCTEQYVQPQKVLLFIDKATDDKVLISSSALECKDLGKEIKGFREETWKREVEQLCYPGLLKKFKTHECLKHPT